MTWWLEKIPELYAKYGENMQAILAELQDMLAKSGSREAVGALPSLSKIQDAIYTFQTKRFLARHMAGAIPAGKPGAMSESDATAMIEADLAAIKAKQESGEATEVGAPTGALLAKVWAWFQANLPAIEADVQQILQFAISILPLLAAL